MQIFYDNLIETATITASSVKTGYPVENLKSYHLSKKFALDANSGTIVFDLGSAKLVNNLIFAGCNMTTGVAITIEGNDSNEWTTPDYTSTATVYSNQSFGVDKVNNTLQYWRVSITDSVDPQIGYAFAGDLLQMPPLTPDMELRYASNTSLVFSVSGQTYADIGEDYFSSTFNFPIILDTATTINGKTIATREDILEFWYSNRGSKPIFLMIYEESLSWIPPIFGIVNQNTLIFKYNCSKNSYDLTFNFTETK